MSTCFLPTEIIADAADKDEWVIARGAAAETTAKTTADTAAETTADRPGPSDVS
ncbi:hypothetical protein [Catenulispora sp. GAS73]|uniref:hypothetical protein n=1 Tax=Catenulispora sp. GAS73 TaxID=3156269 RepID=UPI003515EC6D